MRKLIIPMVVLVGCLSFCCHAENADNINDQTKVSKGISFNLGPIAGVNLSNFIHDNLSGSSSEMRTGFYAGFAARMNLLPYLSIEGDLIFRYRRSGFYMFGNNGSFSQWSEGLNLLAIFHIPMPHQSSFNIGIGAFNDFGLSAVYKYRGEKYDLYNKKNQADFPTMNDSETGIVCKLGYEFRIGLEINATYNFCISNLAEGENRGIGMRPQTLSFGVAWFFNKK